MSCAWNSAIRNPHWYLLRVNGEISLQADYSGGFTDFPKLNPSVSISSILARLRMTTLPSKRSKNVFTSFSQALTAGTGPPSVSLIPPRGAFRSLDRLLHRWQFRSNPALFNLMPPRWSVAKRAFRCHGPRRGQQSVCAGYPGDPTSLPVPAPSSSPTLPPELRPSRSPLSFPSLRPETGP